MSKSTNKKWTKHQNITVTVICNHNNLTVITWSSQMGGAYNGHLMMTKSSVFWD